MDSLPFNSILTLAAFLISGAAARPLSKFLAGIPEFTALSGKLKLSIVILLNVLLALGGFALQAFMPVNVIATLDPWLQTTLTAAWTGWVIYQNQDAYQAIKAEAANVVAEVDTKQ